MRYTCALCGRTEHIALHVYRMYRTIRVFDTLLAQARISNRQLWASEEWGEWCRGLIDGSSRVSKAELPLAAASIRDSVTAKEFIAKKPAVAKRPALADFRRKRSAFTLLRDGSLVTGGVKRMRFKPAVS